jgi:hypothetical protein
VFDLGHLSPSIRWRRAGGGGVSPAFQTDFTAISSLPTGISLTRATTGTYFDASGVLQTAAIDAPRFDHNPVSPFAATGLLIEEQRTTSYIPTTSAAVTRSADVPSSSSPLTGYLAAGPSVWEFQDEATGTIARSAYAAGAFNWPVDKWYRSMGVYPSGTDTSGHMTVGSAY